MAMLITLDCITGLTPEGRRLLWAHNINYAQQLQAILEISALRGPLLAQLGLTASEGRKLRAELKRLCPQWPEYGRSMGLRRYRMGLIQHPSRLRFGGPGRSHAVPLCATLVHGLPPSLSHVPNLPDVRDQGRRGSCVAFGFTALREFMTDRCPPLSEQHLYYLCKELDGVPGSGTYLETAAECLERFGQCEAEVWAYNPDDDSSNEGQGPPPEGAEANAEKYRVLEYQPMSSEGVEEIKAMLYHGVEGRPLLVAVGVPVYESWFNAFTEKHGIINMPYDGDPLLGYHCLAVVGYHDDATIPGGGAFIMRNSWSTGWSSQGHPDGLYPPGYGFVPYDYIRQHNVVTMSLTRAVALRNQHNISRWLPIAAAVLLTAVSLYLWPDTAEVTTATAATEIVHTEHTVPLDADWLDDWLGQYGGSIAMAAAGEASSDRDWYEQARKSFLRNIDDLDGLFTPRP